MCVRSRPGDERSSSRLRLDWKKNLHKNENSFSKIDLQQLTVHPGQAGKEFQKLSLDSLTWGGDQSRLPLDDVLTSQNFWGGTLEPRSVMEGTLLLAFFFFSGNWFDHTDC